ncbi:hypothetical protein Halha_1538 [Halobacteroides halobius DSM 5150]|uniref:DUF304 domain-containing protein n=1 Tax=Halobacteroides halobius (strain ATCC 35273 / DSM 5150 / MD-1) TaxID=748449 RepID=L0KBL5_HALHC|nr:hypothetical protein [Halobacteroides halobius]AGB41478.1 hypothetical protein Halha_1538 [Halobacteroides halobius DSM 5150]
MESLFKSYLSKDERILWIGQPHKGLLFDRREMYLFPISIAALLLNIGVLFVFIVSILSIFLDITISLSESELVNVFIMFISLIILIISFYVFLGRFIYKKWKMKNTYYAITNDKIIVLTDTYKKLVEKIDINRINGGLTP